MIYADYAATTPLLPAAREAMLPWLDAGNPSSLHASGRKAKLAIDSAREIVAEAMGCLFGEICFTSSGTEAANLAIIGAAVAARDSDRRRILFSTAEHHCVLHTKPLLEALGFFVEPIPVDHEAKVDLEALESSCGKDVLLVAVMHANNEVGSFNPIEKVAEICRNSGAHFFCDAVQTFPHANCTEIGADLISVAAHKMYGPKGVGALYVKAGTKLSPIIVGGGQERELRAGTEDVASFVGFSAAIQNFPKNDAQSKSDAANALIESTKGFAVLTVSPNTKRLPGHVHLRIPGHPAEQILISLDRMGIEASSGAACSSGSIEPSHVMIACGYDKRTAAEGLRFTFGAMSTRDDGLVIGGALARIAKR